MSWFDRVSALEALEDAPLDARLVAELERAAPASPPTAAVEAPTSA